MIDHRFHLFVIFALVFAAGLLVPDEGLACSMPVSRCRISDDNPLQVCAVCADQGREGQKCRRRSVDQPADDVLLRQAAESACNPSRSGMLPSVTQTKRAVNPLTAP